MSAHSYTLFRTLMKLILPCFVKRAIRAQRESSKAFEIGWRSFIRNDLRITDVTIYFVSSCNTNLKFRAMMLWQPSIQGCQGTWKSANKVPAALNLFTQQESSSDVLRLIERHGLELIDLGHADVVRRALNVIPHDIRARNPIVLGIRGLASADSGRLDRAESLLQRAAANATDGKLKAALSIKLALILANQMKDSACVLEPLRNADLPDGLRGEIISLLAVSYAYGGRPHDAANAVTEADALVENVESDQDRARILHRLAIAMAQLGMPLDKVLAYQKQAAALAAEHGLFGLAGRAFPSLASIALLYEGDSTKEMWYAQQASTASMKAGDRVNLQTALLQLMDIEGRRGNAERLKALEKQLATVATSDVNRLVYVVAVKAFRPPGKESLTKRIG